MGRGCVKTRALRLEAGGLKSVAAVFGHSF
jgi:hypothetical protein